MGSGWIPRHLLIFTMNSGTEPFDISTVGDYRGTGWSPGANTSGGAALAGNRLRWTIARI